MGGLGRLDDPGHIQVGARTAAVQRTGLVAHPDVQGMMVITRVHRYGRYVQFCRRPHDADGDFTAVGYQYLHCHGHSLSVALSIVIIGLIITRGS